MIGLLERLVNIPSPTGSETETGFVLLQELKNRGYHVITQETTPNRFNILATTDQQPLILFNTHYDTVPGFIPFSQSNHTLYGRGVCDAKGQIVTILDAADKLLEENIRSFGILFVVGEEEDSDGAKKASELSVGSKYVIISEPTENKLVIGQKGTIVFRLNARGAGGHSCIPELGHSAIHELVTCLNNWQELDWGIDPVLGNTTVNIGKITGGTGINIIAEHATAEGIFRVSTSVKDVLNKVEKITNNQINLEIRSESDPQHMLSLPGFETTVVAFGTDAAYLRPLGEILLIGPGSIKFAHKDTEQINIDELIKGSDLLVKAVKVLIKRKL